MLRMIEIHKYSIKKQQKYLTLTLLVFLHAVNAIESSCISLLMELLTLGMLFSRLGLGLRMGLGLGLVNDYSTKSMLRMIEIHKYSMKK